ncbi:MAG: hypothetical protein KJ731_01920 [Alphaproteobacteria bacterium]|nr:hypothetical protein [Alphaproteobacteria bacterium]MBU0826244.1 hypothetical protein [Alphaproteobacteria bacterium]MBU1280596.1 hypothetical protein [Alphaproteobacteria bacterium]MBU1574483.1 hypothetical protein [Alphaproteobacteria bacterium]MBU1827226.1 hypothetical protein [Alphaproteobacteria bacterium]
MSALSPNVKPRLTIDWDAYLPFFEDSDIPEEQKRALIEALWSIVLSFVDLDYELGGTLAQACGQEVSLAKLPDRDVVSSFQHASKRKEP